MMLLAPVTNSEPHGATLAGYCYAMRHGMKVQIVTPYRVSHLQPYGVTVRGNVTGVYRLSTFNLGIKSLRAKLLAVIFYWDFNFQKAHCATSL
jgi:hypothetical protein